MPTSYPTKRTAEEAAAVSGYVPDVANALVADFDCVAAVTQYHAVELVDDGTHAGIQHPGTAGNRCVGIALATGAIGDSVPVAVGGVTRVKLGATLTAPDHLSGATTGKLAAATTGHIVVATLLEDGADTNVVLALILGEAGHAHA